MRKVEFDEMRMLEAGGWSNDGGNIVYINKSGNFTLIINIQGFSISICDYWFGYSPGIICFSKGSTQEDSLVIPTPLYLVRLLVEKIIR